MKTSLFDYNLPQNLIANFPASPRDRSRLMVIDRKTVIISHKHFYDIVDYLSPNDVLVLNKTKVFPARVYATKITGGKVELLFLEEVESGIWKALTHPGLKIGTNISINKNLFNVVGHDKQTALIDTHLSKDDLMKLLRKHGHTPLPPYIRSSDAETNLRKEYQTVYADSVGSVAAPTAGFHFTKRLLNRLKAKGVQIEYVTLHVGLGTFLPVRTSNLENHTMHSEYFKVEKSVVNRLNKAKKEGKKIISVGTTSTRVLETLSDSSGTLEDSPPKYTNIFIYPPYKFKFVDGLVTNFHLPESTLLALVSAFVSHPNTDKEFSDFESSLAGKAYTVAIKEKYRFYSFGDACFIF